MKPIIGVMPLWDDDKASIWMLPGYMDGITAAGGLPIILPMTMDNDELEHLSKMCDGLLFTGGHDVDSKMYGEEPMPMLGNVCSIRDTMERKLLDISLRDDIPILGICRGIQFINVALGGSLYQDIPAQYPTTIDHHMLPPYDRGVHRVILRRDSPLYELLQIEELNVNSYHHQAIKDLSNELIEMARSEDGLIEAVHMPGKRFVWAVQWHPEFLYKTDSNSSRLFKAFVDSCRLDCSA